MKTNAILLLGALLMCLTPTLTRSQQLVGNQQVITVPTNGWTNTKALLSLPDDYATSTGKYPLIIFLHGWGEAGTDINKLINTALPQRLATGYKPSAVNPKDGKTYKFIVVSPQAPDFSYQSGPVMLIIEDMKKKYRIDSTRIYITGISAGGYGTWSCVADDVNYCKKIAAIAPISSMAVDGNRPNTINNAGKYNVGVWNICGTADDKWPTAVDYTNRVNAVNPIVPAKLTGLIGLGHSGAAWNQAYDPAFKRDNMNLYEWMLQFSTSAVSTTPGSGTNIAPVANAGNDATVQLPVSTFSLNGSASTDADGTIASYSWRNISKPTGFTIGLLSGISSTLNNLIAGAYSFELTVTDDKGSVARDTMNLTVNASTSTSPAAGCGKKRVLVPSISNGKASMYINGANYAYSPGDTFVIKSQYNPWGGLDIENFHGTAGCPLVIINEGDVQMEAGFKMSHCSYIKLTGSGSLSKYGFNISSPVGSGPAIEITGRSANIEVERINVRKKAYGAWVKHEASCIDSLKYPNWWIDNISMHDCKFLNIGQDGLYFGSTSPNGMRSITCNGVSISPIPLRLSNIKIFNNIVDSCMRTGIQLSGADKGNNEIYNNTVLRCGYELNQTQGSGIILGGMTRAYVHDNYVRQTFQNGIFSLGAGFSRIENNDIDSSGYIGSVPNPGYTSILADTRVTTPAGDSTLLYIKNNKVGKNATANGTHITIYNTYNGFAAGNVICGNVTQGTGVAATIYVTAGIKWNSNCNTVPPNQAPVANAGADQIITLPTNRVTLQGSGTDADGSVAGYSWAKLSGPSSGSFVSANSANTDVTNLSAGVYIFELTVTDDKGATGKAMVKITVNGGTNNAPVANAGSNQTITLPTSQVTLQGSGTDSDGSIVSYSWTKTSGPASFNIVSGTSAGTVVNSLVAGVYQFELTVTDDKGATGKATVTITVNAAANNAPTANAGSSQTITLPTSQVTLQGSGTDSDGSITGYSWAKVSGPASYNIVSSASAGTDVTNLTQGVYVFELTVTDDKGATGKAPVTITVNAAANNAPAANAGANQSVTLPINLVTLQGSGTDSDGSIVSYSWAKVYGPSSFNISNSTGASTDVSNLTQGVYIFELTVTDDKGATGKATVTITVNALVNNAPTANAGASQTITLPQNQVTLQGSGTDSDGSIAAYSWNKISGPSTYNIVNGASAGTTVINLVAGVYVFELTVTDDKGATDIATVSVTVNDVANKAPVVSAGTSQTISLPQNRVTLQGSATDPDGTITSYLWKKISGPSSYNIASTASAGTDVTNLVAGAYIFELVATDDKGLTGTATVEVTVNSAPNQAPVVSAGTDKTITLPVNRVTLQGSANDPDGSITWYYWKMASGPSSYNIVSTASAATDVTNLVPGVYIFELIAADDKGLTGTATVKVTVLDAVNLAPVVNAGTDKTITLPTNRVTLQGSATDPDGSISWYYWKKVSGPSAYSIVSTTSASTDVINLVQGDYVFELIAADNKGLTGTATVKVTVNVAPNQLPLANAGTDKTITLPANRVTLQGSGTDADGSIVSYSWAKISGPTSFSIVSNTSASTDVTNLVAGVYVFELTVTDNNGGTGKATVRVTVNQAANTAPVANAGTDQSIMLPTNRVTVQGSGSDADGVIVSYSWAIISGPSTFSIGSSTSASTDITNLVAGVYVFELTVTDDKNAKGYDRVTITVVNSSASNKPPIAITGKDTVLVSPASIAILDGGNSKPGGNPIVSYKWEQVAGPSPAMIAAPNAAKTAAHNLKTGTYRFQLTVTDSKGLSSKTTMKVEVIPVSAKNQGLMLYPIPATDRINYRIFDDKSSKIGIAVVDTRGRVVTRYQETSGVNGVSNSLNISELMAGTYFFMVYYADGRIKSTKFIKN